jgi:hypothetical protein
MASKYTKKCSASLAIKEMQIKTTLRTGCLWLTPVILATWEAEIRKITVQTQPRQKFVRPPSPKITRAKWFGGSSGRKPALQAQSSVSNLSPT